MLIRNISELLVEVGAFTSTRAANGAIKKGRVYVCRDESEKGIRCGNTDALLCIVNTISLAVCDGDNCTYYTAG